MSMDRTTIISCYRLLGELLLYPEERQEDVIRQLGPLVASAPEDVRNPLLELLANPAIHDCESYIQELEITPKRPLYLGFYLFDEPESCQSAGTCGRNGYMIELAAIYRHYGLELHGNEMPDFLPLVLEFLALTADRREGEESDLRTRLVRKYVQPAVTAMHTRFSEHGGVWLLAVDALAALLRDELSELPVLTLTEEPEALNVAQPSSTASLKEMP